LGNNLSDDVYTPVSVHGAKKTFCEISASYLASIGIDYKGQTWSWGDDTSYANTGDIIYKTPVRVYNF
jgi:hypothetical protein